MRHRLQPRGGAKNEQAELFDEADACTYCGSHIDLFEWRCQVSPDCVEIAMVCRKCWPDLEWADVGELVGALIDRAFANAYGCIVVGWRNGKRRYVETNVDRVRTELVNRIDLDLVRYTSALHDAPTRQLMAWHAAARGIGWFYDKASALAFRMSDIKASLDTREHIPNKREGQELRRTAAKKHRGQRGRG